MSAPAAMMGTMLRAMVVLVVPAFVVCVGITVMILRRRRDEQS